MDVTTIKLFSEGANYMSNQSTDTIPSGSPTVNLSATPIRSPSLSKPALVTSDPSTTTTTIPFVIAATDTTPATDAFVESASPTTTQIRDFLEGAASIPVSKPTSVIQQGTETLNVSGSQSSDAFCTLLSSYSTFISIFFGTTWICLR